ncbi:MAG: tetratricopeptide repeat protein [Acidobacteriota bacterium]
MKSRSFLLFVLLAALLPPVRSPWAQLPPEERAQVLLRQGSALLDEGRPDAAEPLLRQASLLIPKNALPLGYLGHALMAQRKYREAEEVFREALRLDDESPALGLKRRREAVDGLGLALAFQQDFAGAEALYRKALAEDGAYPPYAYNFACVLALGGHPAEALEALVRALDLASASRFSLPDPALDDDLKGLRPWARFQAALIMNLPPQPDDGPSGALVRQGAALLARGRYAEAAERERQAASADPSDGRAWFFLGGALQESGGPEAGEAYGKACEADEKRPRLSTPARFTAALEAGLYLSSHGRREEAAALLRKAREADPQHPWPPYALARLSAAAGKGDEAREYLRKALDLRRNLPPGQRPLPDPVEDPAFSPWKEDPAWKDLLPKAASSAAPAAPPPETRPVP